MPKLTPFFFFSERIQLWFSCCIGNKLKNHVDNTKLLLLWGTSFYVILWFTTKSTFNNRRNALLSWCSRNIRIPLYLSESYQLLSTSVPLIIYSFLHSLWLSTQSKSCASCTKGPPLQISLSNCRSWLSCLNICTQRGLCVARTRTRCRAFVWRSGSYAAKMEVLAMWSARCSLNTAVLHYWGTLAGLRCFTTLGQAFSE